MTGFSYFFLDVTIKFFLGLIRINKPVYVCRGGVREDDGWVWISEEVLSVSD